MLVLDYVSKQDPEYMLSQGVKGVARYLSYSAGKNIDRAEANGLLAAGLSITLVWETYADRSQSGYSGGFSDAQAAYAQAQGVGQPLDRPIYFAIDFDTSQSDWDALEDYFRGVVQVIGVKRAGAYGEADILDHLFDCGLISWGWETYAWSQGAMCDRAHLYQYSNGMWGGTVDFNRSLKDDFGQWPISGAATKEEEEMQTIRMESSTGDGRQWSGAALNENCSQVGWRIMANIASEPEVAYPFASVHAVVKIHTDEWHVVWEGDVTPTGLAGDWFPRDYNGPVSIEVDQANAVSCYIIEKF